jgi:hypothetical protein
MSDIKVKRWTVTPRVEHILEQLNLGSEDYSSSKIKLYFNGTYEEAEAYLYWTVKRKNNLQKLSSFSTRKRSN